MSFEIDRYAKVIWDYHQLHMPLTKCDAIFTLCSMDDRVAERAAELFLNGYGDYLIFSGGIAHANDNDLRQVSWEGSEAQHFTDIAISQGVPADKILVEDQALNTGQNITFTYRLLQNKSLEPKSLLLVQKPYMERRTFATFKKQWPGPEVEILVTSPQIPYEQYFNEANPKDTVINVMIGDLQRIKEYPALGFQIEQNIPTKVWEALEKLVALGYDKHLIKPA